MSSVFGKKPKMPAPLVSPRPEVPSTSEVRQNTFKELAKRRRATIMNQLTAEPRTLRRTLGA
jgi:hypothetical protein